MSYRAPALLLPPTLSAPPACAAAVPFFVHCSLFFHRATRLLAPCLPILIVAAALIGDEQAMSGDEGDEQK